MECLYPRSHCNISCNIRNPPWLDLLSWCCITLCFLQMYCCKIVVVSCLAGKDLVSCLAGRVLSLCRVLETEFCHSVLSCSRVLSLYLVLQLQFYHCILSCRQSSVTVLSCRQISISVSVSCLTGSVVMCCRHHSVIVPCVADTVLSLLIQVQFLLYWALSACPGRLRLLSVDTNRCTKWHL